MQQQMAMPAGAAAAAVPPAAGITTEQIQKVRFASLTPSLSISLGFLEKMAPLAIASAKDQIFFVPLSGGQVLSLFVLVLPLIKWGD